MSNVVTVPGKVFPSDVETISVDHDELYGGAHRYHAQNCLGFNNGVTEYTNEVQTIQFVQKADDGKVTPGLQSEQLVIILMDRAVKLNARFPSPQNQKMIEGLGMFLDACQERVQERMSRGVMGELKK